MISRGRAGFYVTGLRLRAVGVCHQVVIDERPKGDLVARASSASWVLLALRCLNEMLLLCCWYLCSMV